MSIRKALLMASMALAALAFAAPAASASLPTWTNDHVHLVGAEEVEQSFEGDIRFDRAGIGSFGCDVTATLKAKAGTTAVATAFTPTTSTCTGTGGFAGCVLTTHNANVPWDVHVNGTKSGNQAPLRVTKSGTDVTITNTYHGCAVPQIVHTHLLFEKVDLIAEMNDETTIEGLEIAPGQLDTSGLVSYTGTLELDNPSTPTLGLT